MPFFIFLLLFFTQCAKGNNYQNLEKKTYLNIQAKIYRSLDGKNNNLTNTDWGKSGSTLQRLSKNSQCSNTIRTTPSPREISNVVFHSKASKKSKTLTTFIPYWGQFIDHDISHSLKNKQDSHPIIINNQADLLFPLIPFSRSEYIINNNNCRQQINNNSSFIDGSMIYGNDKTRNATLKDGAKLFTSKYDLLDFNHQRLENDNPLRLNPEELFLAGDVRVNENSMLLSLHTIFTREHNFQVDRIKNQSLYLSEEELYQKARNIVISIIQKITFEEYIPALLNSKNILSNLAYNQNINPTIFNEFSTLIFRMGHSQIPNKLLTTNYKNPSIDYYLNLKNNFFNPSIIYKNPAIIENLLLGASLQPMEDTDSNVVDDLRNNLFVNNHPSNPIKGLDLTALNIKRGRDHNIPNYNKLRIDLGLKAKSSFEDLSSNLDIVNSLKSVYSNIDQVDSFVGMLVEDKFKNSNIGETIHQGILLQFKNLAAGDRFFYQWNKTLSSEDKKYLQNQTLSKVIKRNTYIPKLKDNVFLLNN